MSTSRRRVLRERDEAFKRKCEKSGILRDARNASIREAETRRESARRAGPQEDVARFRRSVSHPVEEFKGGRSVSAPSSRSVLRSFRLARTISRPGGLFRIARKVPRFARDGSKSSPSPGVPAREAKSRRRVVGLRRSHSEETGGSACRRLRGFPPPRGAAVGRTRSLARTPHIAGSAAVLPHLQRSSTS